MFFTPVSRNPVLYGFFQLTLSAFLGLQPPPITGLWDYVAAEQRVSPAASEAEVDTGAALSTGQERYRCYAEQRTLLDIFYLFPTWDKSWRNVH